MRWLLEGFSSVRASFLQVCLKIFEKSGMDRRDNNGIAGSHFYQRGWLEMLLCIVVTASLFNLGLFLLFRRKVKKRLERETAF